MISARNRIYSTVIEIVCHFVVLGWTKVSILWTNSLPNSKEQQAKQLVILEGQPVGGCERFAVVSQLQEILEK